MSETSVRATSLDQDAASGVEHPIEVLREEHARLLGLADEIESIAQTIAAGSGGDFARVRQIAEHLRESESHYLREENVLFPYLEKHGIKQPPAVMWMEHDQIRPAKREIRSLAEALAESPGEAAARRLAVGAAQLRQLLESHFYKEDNILFRMALQVVDDSEWIQIMRGFDELGYPSFSADLRPTPAAPELRPSEGLALDGEVTLSTGSLSLAQLEGILSILPVELTFVDAEDTVRWFSNQRERIFVRTTAAIGREVRLCHPPKSLHLVEQILAEFRAGARDAAEFWLTVAERMLHIRFFAVRGAEGTYLGCLEVTQDVTEIQKLRGEKRLV